MSYIMTLVSSLSFCVLIYLLFNRVYLFLTNSAFHRQDDEDQLYLMDEAGNIEPSQTASFAHLGKESVDAWGDSQDDLTYAESLEDFEQKNGEIPDQLLHTCMLELDM